jgi:nucleotide-binding universal stress UspA family protein
MQQSPISRSIPEVYAKDSLEEMAARIGLQDLEPTILVRHGSVKELLDEMNDYHPSLLILATHGREGVSKWLRGSMTEEIFRGVPWPVLVLGPHLKIDDYDRQFQLRSVLYTTDLSMISMPALQYAAGIAHDHEAKLVALHVETDNRQDFTFERIIALQRLEDWATARIDGMAEALAGVTYEIEFGEACANILQAIAEHQPDLLVMGARGLGAIAAPASHFLGGTAYEVVCNAPCPVLIVPQPK